MNEPWEKELMLARRALSKGLIDGPRLTRLLLEARGRKQPVAKLLEAAGVPAARLPELQQGGAPSWALCAEGPLDGRPRTLLGVRCTAVLEQAPFITTWLGRKGERMVAVHLIGKDAVRQGLWLDFLETVRAAQAVKHPHLLEVLETGKVDDGFVVITDHPDRGTALRKVLDRLARLKLGEALRVAREVAEALAALHAARIAHRDVKAENVLLGGTGVVFLRHAGIVFSPAESVSFAPRGTVFGSPHGIGPECLKGGPPDPKSDIYALGVVLYELVSGVRPFEGERLEDLRKQHLEVAPVRPSDVLNDVPGEVSDLLAWMLAKSPDDRPTPQKLVGVLQGLEKTLKGAGMITARGTARITDMGFKSPTTDFGPV